MRRIRIAIAVVLITTACLFAEDVEWSRIGYKRQGMLIQTPSGEALPVSMSGGATEVTQLIIAGYMQQLTDGTATETTLAQILAALQQLKFSDETYSETIVDLTLTDTGTWYSYSLPENTVSYDIKARTGHDFKVSKSDGGAYQTVWAGDVLKRAVTNGVLSDTLYFNAPDSAGLVLEIRVCKKD
jgi:hypothetical protein